jgi:hypothetical protein
MAPSSRFLRTCARQSIAQKCLQRWAKPFEHEQAAASNESRTVRLQRDFYHVKFVTNARKFGKIWRLSAGWEAHPS